ncbi:sensor histidine kinase [Amycolatopsis jiangsuensis]|uniref:histidine kinase n=1 Tax=Amycolatopsis jiangsuensis TaxID=1181879 RepID=A0A840J7V8_9PSEU|nr:sensor histidine kinase [Amycolatopsis jiangsuensis]MBB4689512.1 signal transduction histidine kinase [Amycolatopsis jiangsuensis]
MAARAEASEERKPGFGQIVRRSASAGGTALGHLGSGLTTAAPALGVLVLAVLAAVSSVVGVGLLLAPLVLRAVHALARRERQRLARIGAELIPPDRPPLRLRLAVADPVTRRELRWLARHGTAGLLLGLLGVVLPMLAVRDLAFPLYWRFAPQDTTATSLGFGVAHSWPDAFAVALLGVGWIALIVGFGPALARLQANPGRRLLAADPGTDLSMRISELTASRAAALDAHAAELRRIERALHDGSQNRMVTVTVLLGAARRQVTRDPDHAGEILERAQSAAEQALAELRSVARSILPPVLTDRGLESALSGLAAESVVPCRIDVDTPERCAASVEATAYFVAAEALTNVAKHSGAGQVTITVRARGGRLRLVVTDDGRGGADESGGSGLTGIRRRLAAQDGTLRLDSPPGGPTILEMELPSGA